MVFVVVVVVVVVAVVFEVDAMLQSSVVDDSAEHWHWHALATVTTTMGGVCAIPIPSSDAAAHLRRLTLRFPFCH